MTVVTPQIAGFEVETRQTAPAEPITHVNTHLDDAREALLADVPTVSVTIHPGDYMDKACLDFYPNRVTLKTLPLVLRKLAYALIGSDWVYERIEWTWRAEVAVDAIWLIRNAHAS